MKNDLFYTFEKADVRSIEELTIIPQHSAVSAMFEAWFDIDKKLGINTMGMEYWVEMHALYHPFDDKIKLEYCILGGDEPYKRQYVPTNDEHKLFIDIIEERCKKEENTNCRTFYLNEYEKYYARDNMKLIFEKAGGIYQIRNTADNFILFKSKDKSMERFVGNDIEFVYYGNHEAYSIESLDLCEVIFSTDSNDYEEADEHEEMEI